MNLDFRTSSGEHKFDVTGDIAEAIFYLLIERPGIKVIDKKVKYEGEPKPETIKCLITSGIEGFRVNGFACVIKKGEYAIVEDYNKNTKKKLDKKMA